MTPVEKIRSDFYSYAEPFGGFSEEAKWTISEEDFEKLIERAKVPEPTPRSYSEVEVREMLFMALYENQEECCVTHTKDSIVRKVIKTFKSQ